MFIDLSSHPDQRSAVEQPIADVPWMVLAALEAIDQQLLACDHGRQVG
jgi:hypothetical protein